ncbi:MAG TPA: hypothetical protein VKX39_03750 [Bryobacteraceae bacterium]|jgi:hypothetical protein|nr:hypothetical protein [Bryobacteraceae bacterium]
MSGFAQQAEEIFRAAESAGSASDLTILLGESGIRVIADSDWPLDSLLWHHGAKTAYRVSERCGTIRVEGRQGAARCLIESRTPGGIARALLG